MYHLELILLHIGKRLLTILIILCIVCPIMAQGISVESFAATTSVEARTHSRLDSDGIPCALIKVRCVDNNLTFKEAVGSVVNHTNEYWVYLPNGETKLTLHSPKESVVVRFSDYGIENVDGKTTYELVLASPSSLSQSIKSFSSKSVPTDFKELADKGDAEAECNLGKCHYLGQGTTQNYYVGLTWFRKSAEKNWAEAQYYIGRCYYYGQGFPKPDFQQAAIWLEKAAKQDFADAQYQLGLCYEKGQGVKQSPKKAQEWYEKAAANGSSKAKQKIQ